MPPQIQPWLRIDEVFHPTDGSPGSEVALLHALRIAAAANARLTLMRVGADEQSPSEDFPNVRAALQRWREQGPKGAAIPEIVVRWHVARGSDPVRSCLKSLELSPTQLIVVATHQMDGKTTWMGNTVAEPLARSAGEMTLLLPEGSPGFVCPEDGTVTLKHILVPVASHPRPQPAVEAVRRLMLYLPDVDGTATLLHIGDPSRMPEIQLPEVPGWSWNQIVEQGDVTKTILEAAAKIDADLIAMTTEGRHGFLDALRGSTTERVLRQARCPMLAMPVGSFLG